MSASAIAIFFSVATIAVYAVTFVHTQKRRRRAMVEFEHSVHEWECMCRDMTAVMQGAPLTEAQKHLIDVTAPVKPVTPRDRKTMQRRQRRIERELRA